MGLLSLIVIIPIYLVGIILYSVNIFNLIIGNNSNLVYLLIGLSIITLLGYFIIKNGLSLFYYGIKYLNLKLKDLIMYQIYLSLLFCLTGISFLISNIFSINIVYIIIGFIFLIMVVLILYDYFKNIKVENFTLKEIKIGDNKKYNVLVLNNVNSELVYNIKIDDFNYKINEIYQVKYYNKTGFIYKIDK